jgi:hypothetical protein
MKTKMIVLFLFIFSFQNVLSRVHTDWEAKNKLREWNVFSTHIIENVEIIIIHNNQIQSHGGIGINLPVFASISENNIILLRGASGFKTRKRTIIEADFMHISAVIININRSQYLVVGQSLRDIVNYLLE